jgi:pseudouridine synthase
MEIRLQKILAKAGVASRRRAEEIIAAGRVAVNGVVVREMGAKVCETDEITVDGAVIYAEAEKMYIMLHKPEGVVTTAGDPMGRPIVLDYVPAEVRLFPVGRLDFETSGLLFLTNDGDWANGLIHPRHEVYKVYLATLRGVPIREDLRRFESGLEIEGRLTAPAKIVVEGRGGGESAVRITIREGRNRQVRKMCAAIGCPVLALKRVAIGGVQLGNLAVGEWRSLTESERIECKKF